MGVGLQMLQQWGALQTCACIYACAGKWLHTQILPGCVGMNLQVLVKDRKQQDVRKMSKSYSAGLVYEEMVVVMLVVYTVRQFDLHLPDMTWVNLI